MEQKQSDGLVLFGATGDLAYKKSFPALQAMVKSGRLEVPVIGVARESWTVEQLRARKGKRSLLAPQPFLFPARSGRRNRHRSNGHGRGRVAHDGTD
jgi:Glucose-6-phosphate dehydrogenase, NAD binding domain